MAFRSVIKEGYLKKTSEKVLGKRQVQRWFILVVVNNQPILESYVSREASVRQGPTNSFNLSHCQDVIPQMAAADRSRFIFDVVLPDRRLTLQSTSETDMDDWMRRLKFVIERYGSHEKDNVYRMGDEYDGAAGPDQVYADGDGDGSHSELEDDIDVAKAKAKAKAQALDAGGEAEDASVYSSLHTASTSTRRRSVDGACGGPPLDGSRNSNDSGSGGRDPRSHPLPAVPPDASPDAAFPPPPPGMLLADAHTEMPDDWKDNPFVMPDPPRASASPSTSPEIVGIPRPRPRQSTSATVPAQQGPPPPQLPPRDSASPSASPEIVGAPKPLPSASATLTAQQGPPPPQLPPRDSASPSVSPEIVGIPRPRPSPSNAGPGLTRSVTLPSPHRPSPATKQPQWKSMEDADEVYGHMWENGSSESPPAAARGTSVAPYVMEKWINELDAITERVTDIDLWLQEIGLSGVPIDELEDDVYDRLEAKLECKKEWSDLNDLRTRRNQSATNVFRPNPAAPDYDPSQPPLQLAGFFEKKVGLRGIGEVRDHSSVKEGMLTVRRTNAAAGNALFITAGPDATLSALAGAVEAVKRQILHPGGVVASFRLLDLRTNVAFVDANSAVWIGGWNPKAVRLHRLIHIGDQVVGVNDCNQKIDSTRTLLKLLDSLPGDDETCQLRLRRMPHGKVLAIRREKEGQSLGIERMRGTNEIAYISRHSLAARHGLTSLCTNFDPIASGSAEGNWCITEVNGRSLCLFFKNNEADIALKAMGSEISLAVQPLDLIKRIRKATKSVKRYKGFVGQS